MELTNSWGIVLLPQSHNKMSYKWIYKVKYQTSDYIECYKARLVTKGYNQQEGVNFIDTFLPVAKIASVKILLPLAASYG